MLNKALEPRVDTVAINNRLKSLDRRQDNALKTLIREFKISQRDYEVFKEGKVWGQALRNLEHMHRLMPYHPDDRLELEKILQLNTSIERYLDTRIWECKRMMR